MHTPIELENINVDELQFEVVFEGDFFAKNPYPVIDPDGKKLIREHKKMIATQFPEIYIRYYGNWGFVYDYLPGRDVFVIQIGDWHMSATSIEDLSLARPDIDNKRIWEIDNFGSYNVKYYGVIVSQPNKFKNRQQQDTIVALLTKALSDFNHLPSIERRRKDGKEITSEESKLIRKMMVHDNEAYQEYKKRYLIIDDVIDRCGDSEIAFSQECLENLKRGTWIES